MSVGLGGCPSSNIMPFLHAQERMMYHYLPSTTMESDTVGRSASKIQRWFRRSRAKTLHGTVIPLWSSGDRIRLTVTNRDTMRLIKEQIPRWSESLKLCWTRNSLNALPDEASLQQFPDEFYIYARQRGLAARALRCKIRRLALGNIMLNGDQRFWILKSGQLPFQRISSRS